MLQAGLFAGVLQELMIRQLPPEDQVRYRRHIAWLERAEGREPDRLPRPERPYDAAAAVIGELEASLQHHSAASQRTRKEDAES